ncbi:MAG: acyl-CoA dehydrogenase family protein [Chitinophagales bacterium]
MNTTTQTDIKTFRAETRAWLEANCPKSMRTPIKSYEDIFWGGTKPHFDSEDQKLWFERMRDKGWTAPAWPKEYGGGGLDKLEHKVFKEEMARINARPPLFSFGLMMLGPALLHFGSEEQKMKYIPEICRGEIWWCQGYSEPGSGSDLASLQTKAEDMGDHFLINGQKIWTSYADKADKIFCLVRTNPKAPKHTGISFLLIDMDQEGVTTRPIKLISGKSPFCETFFDNAIAPKENLVGTLNDGWTIAKYLLTHERSGIGLNQVAKPLHQLAIEEIGLENEVLMDPILRPKIAQWMINETALKLTIERTTDEAKAGQSPGAKSSFFKYYATELNKEHFEMRLLVKGFEGVEWGETYNDGKLARDMCRTKGNSIEGGTSEVMLNIIAKRILGLPSR